MNDTDKIFFTYTKKFFWLGCEVPSSVNIGTNFYMTFMF